MENTSSNSLTLSKHITSKIEVIETSLHQTLYNFRDFVAEFQQMYMEAESLKKQIIAQKEKCESKCCNGSEELKKVIESKENIIQLIASAVTKLSETKNFNILTEVYKILFGESNSLVDNIVDMKKEINSDSINIVEMTVTSIKEEPPENMVIDDGLENVSVSEIEGTPTGRCSPIIQSKKLKSSTPNNTILREKKKCPESRKTPEKKSAKLILSYPTPTRSKGGGRLRQQRITVLRDKPTTLVDLTTTPQFSKGRNSQNREHAVNDIKQEITENDDTIMPSPTSGPPVCKPSPKKSPQKFKKPLSLIRGRGERGAAAGGKENKPDDVTTDDVTVIPEPESVDLLKGFPNSFISPKKCEQGYKSPPNEANNSISLLQQHNTRETVVLPSSEEKRPLAENLNVVNVPSGHEESVSILPRELKIKSELTDDKRGKCQVLEPLYKEPTVRKKAEKRALPGWSCERCEKFYGELYEDNPEMLAKKMAECSKHRGRTNPARPKTPPGYWRPRWEVPEDTDEFNRRNDAV